MHIYPPDYHHNGFVATYVHELPKRKAIMVITGRAHCLHDCIYILCPSCFVRFEHFVCHGSLMTTYI